VRLNATRGVHRAWTRSEDGSGESVHRECV
jgi:hypothetical protein